MISAAVDVKVWNRTSNTYIDLTSMVYSLPTIVFIKTYVISDYVRKKICIPKKNGLVFTKKGLDNEC